MAETIDAHHHLWRYNGQEYGWLAEGGMEALERDYLLPELHHALADAGVAGTVAVQARQTMEETRWLLLLARETAAIRGVVGWAPIAEPGFAATVQELAGDSKLKGLRHVIQGEADGFMLRQDFNDGIRAMLGTGLVYDVLIKERQLPEAIEFVDRHPQQSFVLDHMAKPAIRAGLLAPWAERMRELASRQNVCCKISGMVTEADWTGWTPATLRPYLDVVLEAFGPERLMAGSDWPVCLVACGYRRWFEVVAECLEDLVPAELQAVMGGTARRIDRL